MGMSCTPRLKETPHQKCFGCSIRAYAAYLDTLEEVEDEHPACTANRLLLEHTWQVVANEFYDASGRFSQAPPCFMFGLSHSLPSSPACTFSRSG